MSPDDPRLDRATAILRAHPRVGSAWLFGSTAAGRAGPASDVALALLLKSPLTLQEHLGLIADLEEALGAEVDLSILNQASPILRFEAIKGKNIVCQDRADEARFVSLTCREYETAMSRLERDLAWRRSTTSL